MLPGHQGGVRRPHGLRQGLKARAGREPANYAPGLPPVANDFFEVRNGRKLRDMTAGTVTIVGRLITPRHKVAARYVVCGWLELPGMIVLQVAGPWYDGREIPAKLFTDSYGNSQYSTDSRMRFGLTLTKKVLSLLRATPIPANSSSFSLTRRR